MAIRILSDQNVTSNVIAIQAFRLGTDSLWKIRGNAASTELVFEYSTSSALSDANIKVVFNSSGDVGIGDNVTPSQKLHVAGNIYSINSGTDGGQIRLANSGGGSNWYWAARTTGLNLGELGVADGNIFIANGGNVGIDTTDQTPEKFNVDGNIIMVGGSTNTGYDRYFKIYGNTQPVNNPNRWAGMAVYNNGGNNVNELAFFTGSGDDARTEKVRIDSGGRVGIGTDDPQSKLHSVVTTAGDSALKLQDDTGSVFDFQCGIAAVTGDALVIKDTTLSYDYLTLRSGNVGIGTDSPSNPLEISSDTSTSLVYQRTGVSANKWGFHSDNDATYWQNVTSGSLLFTLQNGGDVGIGTTNPVNKLGIEVAANSNTKAINIYSKNIDADAYTSIGSQYSISNTYVESEIRFGNETYTGGGSYLGFVAGATNTGNTEKMRITSSGNVGIGTTTPNGKVNIQYDMDVDTGSVTGLTAGRFQYGNINFSGVNAQTSGTAGTTMQGITWQVNNYLGSTNYGNQAQLVVGNNGNIGTFMGFFTSDNYSAAPVEAIRIDSTQNVGIGTVSPGQKLHINDGSVVTTTDANNMLLLTRDNHSYIMFSCPDGKDSGLHFHNTTDNSFVGRIAYDHNASGDNMLFTVNSTERMRITSAGFTKAKANGVGSFGGNYHEFVNNNNVSGDRAMVIGNPAGSATNNTSSIAFTVADNANDRLKIFGNGNVVNLNNSYGASSDIKLKENIIDATSKLDDLMKVKIRNYNFIGDDKKQIGVVAQELEDIFPNMIDESIDYEYKQVTDEEGNTTEQNIDLGTTTKSVKYSVFVPMLIKAVQELKAEIEILKNK